MLLLLLLLLLLLFCLLVVVYSLFTRVKERLRMVTLLLRIRLPVCVCARARLCIHRTVSQTARWAARTGTAHSRTRSSPTPLPSTSRCCHSRPRCWRWVFNRSIFRQWGPDRCDFFRNKTGAVVPTRGRRAESTRRGGRRTGISQKGDAEKGRTTHRICVASPTK